MVGNKANHIHTERSKMKVINGKVIKDKMFKDQRKLVGFYWGYDADKGQDGFEFTHQHLVLQGQSLEVALQVGAIYKKAATEQWQGVMRGDPKYLEGATREEFIDEEFDRLLWVIEELRDADGKITLNRYSELALMACCAISTLVAAGRIPQNTWNGDSFMEHAELETA